MTAYLEKARMDSMGKIVEEMRFAAINDWADKRDLTEWADRIDALTKDPVVEANIVDCDPNVRRLDWSSRDWWATLPPGIYKLFAAPPAHAVTTQDLDDFLSQVQARVIELGYMPPAWPTNGRDGTDDPVESAARMICGLLDAAAPAPATKSPYKDFYDTVMQCSGDIWQCKLCGNSEPWWTETNADYATRDIHEEVAKLKYAEQESKEEI